MDQEQWFFTIDNASSIWMAGMMTIQTFFILVTAYLAFKTHEQYYEKKVKSHAISIKKNTQKLIYIQDIIFNLTDPVDFKDYQFDLKKKMKGDHMLMYVKSARRHNLFLKYKREIEKLQMKVERELEFLGDKHLKSINTEREKLFQDIIRKFLVVEGKISSLYNEKDLEPQILKNQENIGYKVYQLIPELIGHEEDQSVFEINLIGGVSVRNRTQKPRGLKLLDKQFNDSLAKFY
ncbi:hypothetical protein SAMN04488104_103021 [Algoriphagus faecimaris]|uniref:Uncharacterized protein n=1 Tax=Algoriphagus faecimaris TaxID=686796 RepID=A0A1G6USR9_9BACT|nr:hypothetical protein [Algoriphagus faecimaris]SDD44362.1 hypothetical protein SAMN04488104_103021 [Algoriphagus faecimaris]